MVEVNKKALDLAEAKDLLTNPDRFPEFCEKCLFIIPIQGGQLIPFKLNAIQKWFWFTHVVPLWNAGAPIRIILLKCRQTGMSTLISAFSMWCTLGNKHWNSLLVAKNDEQSKIVFEMTHRYKENLPEAPLLPYFPTNRDSQAIIEFNKPDIFRWVKKLKSKPNKVYLDSRIRILSGEKKGDLGRAGTFQTVHGSECAFWVDLTNSLSAVMACCHYRPKTALILETTANGYNEFHTLWTNRRVGKKDIPNYWKTVFLPWYWDEKYEIYDTGLPEKFISEYEEMLFKRIITDHTIEEVSDKKAWAKIFWRRMAIEDRQGDEDAFAQEYPATPSEAFISTGRPVFPKSAIKRWEMHQRKPIWQGNIFIKSEKKVHVPELVEAEYGRLKIFEEPETHEQYVIGADIAEGKALEGVRESKERFDFSVAQVLKITPFPPAKQVAVWHGSLDPDLFADVMVALALHYNNAYLGWEVNNAGRGCIYHVQQRLRYNRVYRRESYDTGGARVGKEVGWFTSGTTKPMMVFIGKEFARDEQMDVYDQGTVEELKAFSAMGDGKFQAAQGHDDRVMALLLACAIAQPRMPIFQRFKEKSVQRAEAAKAKKNPILERMKNKGHNEILGSEF